MSEEIEITVKKSDASWFGGEYMLTARWPCFFPMRVIASVGKSGKYVGDKGVTYSLKNTGTSSISVKDIESLTNAIELLKSSGYVIVDQTNN